MKKIVIKGVNETIYYEKLDNGLDVYLYPKKTIHNNYVTFTTKYGSIYNAFKPIGEDKIKSFPKGIAHFLEHKMFEQKDGPTPFEFFSKNGASANAYTTFKNTTYLFMGPNNLEENLIFLLDYVQSPYFTEDNVLKEKGIIKREISMCNDRPSDRLYDSIRSSVFYDNPFKDSIIGTDNDIDNITKDMLFTCYNTFYHPKNMFLVITGNFDVDNILKIIKDNQKDKEFSKLDKIEIKDYKEKNCVSKKDDIIKMDTEIAKMSYNIKISYDEIEISKRELNLYLYLLFNILFDETSEFNERMLKENIITNSLFVNTLNCDTHVVISLINETDNYEILIKNIENQLKNIKINQDDFERKKKVLLSNEVFSYENIEIVNDMIIDNILFDNRIEENIVSIINNLNIDTLNKIIKNIDLSNVSKVIIDKK